MAKGKSIPKKVDEQEPIVVTTAERQESPDVLEVEVLTKEQAAKVRSTLDRETSETIAPQEVRETGLAIREEAGKAALNLVKAAWRMGPEKALKVARLVLAKLTGKALKGLDDVDAIDRVLKQGRYTTPYPSEVGFYGYAVNQTNDHIVYMPQRLALQIEDGVYAARDGFPLELVSRDKRTKRLRRKWRPKEKDQLMQHIKALGLSEHFFMNNEGYICERTDDIRSGLMLYDLLALRSKEGDEYAHVRKFAPQIKKALSMAARKVENIHHSSPKGIGEIVVNDFVLKVEGDEIVDVRLSLPDVRFEDTVDAMEQKATELTDLLWSAASAGYVEGGAELAVEYLRTLLDNYQHEEVLAMLSHIIDTRPTYGYISNRERLGFKNIKNSEQVFEEIREMVKNILGQKKAKMLPPAI